MENAPLNEHQNKASNAELINLRNDKMRKVLIIDFRSRERAGLGDFFSPRRR